MNYLKAIEAFVPQNEQELADKEFFLKFASETPNCLLRSSCVAHFTASAWAISSNREKILMIYHNIYKSWSWTGGHADGNSDLAQVAMRELMEESGVKNVRLVSDIPLSLETLAVSGHYKSGIYVPSHLHLNLSYLIQVDETDRLFVKPDENSNVAWFNKSDIDRIVNETWMLENVYKKLIARM